MPRKLIGALLITFLLLIPARADKSKKAYELIYQDIQVIKQQIIQLEEKIKINTEDVESIRNQLKELITQIRLLQTDQAALKEDIKVIPVHYQVLLNKLEEMSLQIIKISEGLIVFRNASSSAQTPEEEKLEEKPALSRKEKTKKNQEAEQEKEPDIPTVSLSPQEVYNMALSDYRNGNFQLAIDGFKIYINQFSDSPFADNAQYWIGECFFSQGKFEEAIEEFNNLILNYPNGDKVPGAYLKKGISFIELGRKEEALSAFKLLISKYPLSEETKIAQQKMKELLSRNERY
ncbi:MAG: tol-pal system protein YbgF [Candidatus Aminicenantaceae bacterium]